jgi:hypothetical protein
MEPIETADPTDREGTDANRWAGPLLAALLLVSFALRAWDASQGLQAGRYFDERFTFRNVTQILRRGEWRPQQAFYLSLSYLPQTAVLATSQKLSEITGLRSLSIYGKTADRYSPTAYLLARGVNVLYGTLSLLVVFLVGRRLFSPGTGLLAAAILAAFPRHVLSSTQFKPDILVLLLTIVTFYWSVKAALDPRPSRYALAGLGVGLGVATKYTGVGSAIAIAAAGLVQGWKDRRRWLWLLLAAAVSGLTFVALNPYLGTVFQFGGRLVHGYAVAGEKEGSGHAVVLLREADFLLEHHGPVVAALVALGVIGLLWRVWKPDQATPPWPRERRIGAALLLVQFLGYSLVHAAGMTLFRGQNFLPVVPFSSLAAAWAAVEIWRALTRRIPALAWRPVAMAFWAIPAVLLLNQQASLVYLDVVPTNQEAAGDRLSRELAPLDLRHVVFEREAGPLRLIRGTARALTTAVDRLPRAPVALLDLSDAEVFPRSRFQQSDGDFYRARDQANPGEAQVVASRPFRSRGNPIVVLYHPWTPAPPELLPMSRTPKSGQLAAHLPEGLQALAPGAVISIVLWAPREGRVTPEVRFEPGDLRAPLYESGHRTRRVRLVTTRLRLTGAEERVVVPTPPGAFPRAYRLELHRWAPAPPRRP